MSSVPFSVTLNYRNETSSFFQSLQNFVENYFSIGGRVIVIQPDGMTALPGKYTPSWNESLLKILSYATLAIPPIMLVGKVGLRLYARLIVWMESGNSEFPEIRSLPHQNNRVKNELGRLFQERAKQLYWIPHPKFEKGDLLHFPDQRINFFAFNKVKDQVVCFGRDKLQEMIMQQMKDKTIGDNDFLKWLNGKTRILDREYFFQSKKECFMNCSDFVYLLLYQAGLISKEKIISIYRNEVARNLEGTESNTFYGFDLSAFKDFDSKNGAKKEVPKPGDLLVGFIDGKPAHVLFLSGKNLETSQWKGAGLWNMGNEMPIPSDIELHKLQEDCHRNHQILTFKYCSLERALATF